jgi:hypothetical protein
MNNLIARFNHDMLLIWCFLFHIAGCHNCSPPHQNDRCVIRLFFGLRSDRERIAVFMNEFYFVLSLNAIGIQEGIRFKAEENLVSGMT